MMVVADDLNVREHPYIGAQVVGSLKRGEFVYVDQVVCREGWARIGQGRYAAIVYGGQQLLGKADDK
jgi:uncharacterized protein YgiM (DUF1202 family)